MLAPRCSDAAPTPRSSGAVVASPGRGALARDAVAAAIPVVLCSGGGSAAAAAARRLPNVFGFLTKPFPLRALQALVEAALEENQGGPVVMARAPLPTSPPTGHRHLSGTRPWSLADPRTTEEPEGPSHPPGLHPG